MSKIILHVDHISVQRYGQDHPVLDDVTVQFKAGQLVALCGHNGAGKTTLARAMLGLIPLANGTIYVEGQPLDRNISHDVQMVFQPPMAQIIGDTVFEELAITLLQRDACLPSNQLAQLVTDACRRVGLHVPLTRGIRELSGGELQRLCIAQALLSEAKILILDEALSSLDPDARTHLRQHLRRLAKESNTTLLMISHDMEDVLAADRVLVMEQGRLIHDGTPIDFFYGNSSDTDGTESPCESFGFEPPYLVQTARAYSRRTGHALTPVDEHQFVEELSNVTVPS
ncbi:energy-coupling factor ABC transporter ATP-binding protein [Alicyclobacillus dauci]|uniref:Energy-coupling factor ABC transporter ATP-binding protein n=1 Tax=Alicyclobacillus dauci TaxID=1475485 RepID=A0ABY6Z1K8_9BACL|nr:ABC transporter ATP-binding protein [Alicyclobacillus dauci]WAH36625.1 energy-coupling factor ABC transporter ATP-binding protein [Alicyclobacillus dauci]